MIRNQLKSFKKVFKVGTVLPVILFCAYTKPGWFPVIRRSLTPLLMWDFVIGCSHSRCGSSGLAVEPVCDLGASLCVQWAHEPDHCSSLRADRATASQLLQR